MDIKTQYTGNIFDQITQGQGIKPTFATQSGTSFPNLAGQPQQDSFVRQDSTGFNPTANLDGLTPQSAPAADPMAQAPTADAAADPMAQAPAADAAADPMAQAPAADAATDPMAQAPTADAATTDPATDPMAQPAQDAQAGSTDATAPEGQKKESIFKRIGNKIKNLFGGGKKKDTSPEESMNAQTGPDVSGTNPPLDRMQCSGGGTN